MTTPRNVLGALYAWLAAMLTGAVLVDIAYASFLRDADGPMVQVVFSEVSDFLLIPAGLAVLAAVAAVAISWALPPARNLFLLGLLALSLELVVPIFLSPMLRTFPDLPDLVISPVVRLIPLGLASLLALAGFRQLFR